VRRAVALGVVAVACVAPGTAWAGSEEVTLRAGRQVVLHGTAVRFSGAVTPQQSGIQVEILRTSDGTESRVGGTTTGANGAYSIGLTLTTPGSFVARASVPGPDVTSSPVTIRIRPRLTARFVGSTVVGHALYLRGRVKPVTAGVLTKRIRGITRRVAVGRAGNFRIRVSTGRALPVRVRLQLRPAGGYVARGVTKRKRLKLPYLSDGSHGRSVRALERLLDERQYALRGVNRRFGGDTAEAVIAFQKVKGLRRTGRVGPRLWRRLARSGTPKARVARGSHIEISKTHQVIYEVRRGEVVNVIHTSTGATGNTPVGRWRVYGKVPGYNASHMYYSLFFLRGFAIHGYASVPPWPASHGCARIPLWAAPGLFSRWSVGSRIIVFA
jgi:Putative peptidoglycan binding domain/L,D-transpeptidase catalytic domain